MYDGKRQRDAGRTEGDRWRDAEYGRWRGTHAGRGWR